MLFGVSSNRGRHGDFIMSLECLSGRRSSINFYYWYFDINLIINFFFVGLINIIMGHKSNSILGQDGGFHRDSFLINRPDSDMGHDLA